ncbi:MAG: acyl carrier protein [Actinomycetota bacterium]|nr:acyl carrier protein [Actinomycetota bacterium]
MTREELFERVRDHLAAELAVDPSAIRDDTRFKEDLNADSLHLVELMVELEDDYGIRVPDDEAARIKTVGQVVDFVAARAPERAS